MKFVLTFALACVISAIATAQLPSGRQDPFVPMAVSYSAELVRNRERAAADFDAIRADGFNAVRLVVSWADVEPVRGQYRLEVVDGALELASRSGLRVIVRLDAASSPAWVFNRYPDGRYVPADGAAPAATRACFDHPGVRADVEAFVTAVTAKAASHAALLAVDVGSDLDSGFCLCPHTARRFREWTKATFGEASRSPPQRTDDQTAFVAITRRDHLAWLAAAAAARGNRPLMSSSATPSLVRPPEAPVGQDDWLMARVVDRYGVVVPPSHRSGSGVSPSQLALAFDGVRSAAAANGWFVSLDDDTSAADLRLWTWAAVSRGARGVMYGDWRTGESSTGAVLSGADVRVAERAQTAAGLSRVIGRNPALFAPLRPGRAKVAIIYDPRADAARIDWARVYQAFFERNIQVDVVHLDELGSGAISGYVLVASRPSAELPAVAAGALKAYADSGGKLLTLSTRAPAVDEIVRVVEASGVTPVVRISGAGGVVETRFLESSDVLMLIGLNHSDTRQRVTMTFPPDTQEAIWQNMETGAAVNFIAGPDGPTYTYTFGARDALVLMIRKNIR